MPEDDDLHPLVPYDTTYMSHAALGSDAFPSWSAGPEVDRRGGRQARWSAGPEVGRRGGRQARRTAGAAAGRRGGRQARRTAGPEVGRRGGRQARRWREKEPINGKWVY